MVDNNVQSVIIIGGGLVGSLCGNFMAKRGYRVTLYEYRDDIRKTKIPQGRSINLSISHRGRRSLSVVELEKKALEAAVPMVGRFIHDSTGKTRSIPYDSRTNQCIYSVGRNYLNELLLTGKATKRTYTLTLNDIDFTETAFLYAKHNGYMILNNIAALEGYPSVEVRFNHKLVGCNLDEGTVTVLNTKTRECTTTTADLIIGADGAYSTLRKFMQQTPRFEYSQHYIDHGYLELTIPPENSHRMEPNHLHIWPRGEFMMIALPNRDESWTVTLFMDFRKFESLKSEEQLLSFFYETFPDAVPLIGEKALVGSFLSTSPSPLVSIKCHPYHVCKKFLIVGDAAHAMVPFYGQGMNAGFEDCFILNKILDETEDNIEEALPKFSAQRKEDAYAICDLAVYNYLEMRDLVTRKSYYFRKRFDEVMSRIFPNKWMLLYNSVTFSYMGYRQCIEQRKWQNMVINSLLFMSFILVICVVFGFKTVFY